MIASFKPGTEPVIAAAADDHPWYALRVKSRCEFAASEALTAKGYTHLAPFWRSGHASSGRVVQDMDMPLFPGYVFCRFDAADPQPVLSTPGVVHVLSAGKKALPLDGREVAAIQAVCESGLRTRPWPFLQAGRRVVLQRGPLAGADGIVTESENELRLVVSLTLLQRSVATEIDAAWVQSVL
ncbi:MAG TPA: transcription termination/antitermination NusG family protein [Bryobacteraceae bacterium]|nr:transcription termination/antitermination NusG family protein [Bryobacteraceae bacterium]